MLHELVKLGALSSLWNWTTFHRPRSAKVPKGVWDWRTLYKLRNLRALNSHWNQRTLSRLWHRTTLMALQNWS